jgi:holo-[acyl-carrier protein] synthase
VFWKDMGVVNEPSGRPTLHLTGGAARHLARLTPVGWTPQVHLTLTDDFPMAHAVVVISVETTRGSDNLA